MSTLRADAISDWSDGVGVMLRRPGDAGPIAANPIYSPGELAEDRIDGKTGLAKRELAELPAFTFSPEEEGEEEDAPA